MYRCAHGDPDGGSGIKRTGTTRLAVVSSADIDSRTHGRMIHALEIDHAKETEEQLVPALYR